MHTPLILDALKAQSIADAIGRKFEFQRNIDWEKVEDEILATHHVGITDDTQMTLFGMEAMTEIWNTDTWRPDHRLKIFMKHYVDWYYTQSQHDRCITSTWLGKHKQMHHAVAPGGTCLKSLEQISQGRVPYNDSNGCGSVMKALPLALALMKEDPVEFIGFATAMSCHTHGSVETGQAVLKYMEVAKALMAFGESHYLDRIASKGEVINQWRGGWNATDCLNMACWAVGNANTFEEMLILSITHDGDSDSVAAVAGALWALGGRPIDDLGEWIFKHRVVEHKLVTEVGKRFDQALNRA